MLPSSRGSAIPWRDTFLARTGSWLKYDFISSVARLMPSAAARRAASEALTDASHAIATAWRAMEPSTSTAVRISDGRISLVVGWSSTETFALSAMGVPAESYVSLGPLLSAGVWLVQ